MIPVQVTCCLHDAPHPLGTTIPRKTRRRWLRRPLAGCSTSLRRGRSPPHHQLDPSMHNAQALHAHGPASSFGGQEPIVPLSDFHPPNRPGLADHVMQSLLRGLGSYGLTPTRSMSTGLYAAAQALEAMAEGTLSPQFHLSSLDPGMGKTTLIRHFIMALLASPHRAMRDFG